MKTFLAAAFIVMAGSLTISAQHAVPLSGTGEESQHADLLPRWEEGFLDIHTIATGRGDACLIILSLIHI